MRITHTQIWVTATALRKHRRCRKLRVAISVVAFYYHERSCPTHHNLLETCGYELLAGMSGEIQWFHRKLCLLELIRQIFSRFLFADPRLTLISINSLLFLQNYLLMCDVIQSSTSHVVQYVTRAATAVRGAVKEPLKAKLEQQQIFTYKAAKWEAGLTAPKEEVTSLSMAGKM